MMEDTQFEYVGMEIKSIKLSRQIYDKGCKFWNWL
jgi:hypothetical protein